MILTYDSWGKLESITGELKDTVGVKNPYRDRGYRYDIEIGLYYSQSRYYNSEWGRFINADAIVGQSGKLLSHIMYSYCFNDPVNMEDTSGYWAWLNKLYNKVVNWFNTVPTSTTTAIGRASTVFTVATGSLDIANTWTANINNTNGQRCVKMGVQLGGVAAACKVGMFAVGLANAWNPVGWGAIGIFVIATGVSMMGATIISGTQNQIYKWTGIE